MQAPSKSIFLSYRREESEEVVDRIYETLTEQFSREALFRDLDDIAPGENFSAVVRQRLRDCDVVLVFIGRDWLTVQAQGQPRLLDPNDHLRVEVQTALGHLNAQTIPVLVKRAVMPRADQLPPALAPLSNLNALTVRSAGRDYRQDMQALVEAIAQGIERSTERRRAAAERGLSHLSRTGTGGIGSSIEPLSEASWQLLLAALASHSVVVVCGSEFGTDPAQTGLASREAPMAAQIAATLALPAPSAGSRRPLADLAAQCYRDGRRDEFARALRDAAVASSPVVGLDALRAIEPLRVFVTAAIDPCLEMALTSQRGAAVVSEAYSVAEPGRLDRVDIDDVPALVFHVAGTAAGLDGDAAVTDGDWLRFAREWRARRPQKLRRLFEDCAVLFLGGGHPRGFVEFWVEMARELNCRSLWVATSAIEEDAALLHFLSEGLGSDVLLFDDVDGSVFLHELARRWESRVEAPISLPPEPADTVGPESAASQRITPSVPFSLVNMSVLGRRSLLDPERPWPGLMAYDEEHCAFFNGRSAKVEHLVQSLRSFPLTVLVARSGNGKTSLIRAGLMPALRAQRMLPVIIRLAWAAGDERSVPEQVLQDVAAQFKPMPAPQPGESLWSFFHRKDLVNASARGVSGASKAGGARSRFVLIFDQFEEIFVVPAASAEGQQRARAGWRDLADLVEGRVPLEVRERCDRDPSLAAQYDFRAVVPSVLLSLREDFMPQLMPLATEMPSLGRSTVRLSGLSREEALQAVLHSGAGHFTPEAATAVVRFLQSEGTGDVPRSPFEAADINPALLSATCYRLNEERLARMMTMVDLELVSARQDGVLSEFYQEAFRGLEPAARHWVEDELVTAGGYRDSIDLALAHAHLQARGVSPGTLEKMVDRRLLRVADEGTGARVELSHDLLINPVRKSRAARSPAQTVDKNPLSRLLDRLGRPSSDKG